jgi:hypothetical protein
MKRELHLAHVQCWLTNEKLLEEGRNGPFSSVLFKRIRLSASIGPQLTNFLASSEAEAALEA